VNAIYFQVRYELIGRGKAQKYFQIDSDTGVIQVRDDLRKETSTEYEVYMWLLFVDNVLFYLYIRPFSYHRFWGTASAPMLQATHIISENNT
jgi:hypothetical protein